MPGDVEQHVEPAAEEVQGLVEQRDPTSAGIGRTSADRAVAPGRAPERHERLAERPRSIRSSATYRPPAARRPRAHLPAGTAGPRPGRSRSVPPDDQAATGRRAEPGTSTTTVSSSTRRELRQSLTWKIASISTAISPGSEPMPTALRAPLPGSPKTSTIRSEKPLMTLGWSTKSGVAVDHAQDLDQPDDLVERAEVAADGRQDRQAGLPRGGLPARDVEVGPDLAGDQRAVGPERAVARDVEQVAVPDGRHVGCHGLRAGGNSSFSSARRASAPMEQSSSVRRFDGFVRHEAPTVEHCRTLTAARPGQINRRGARPRSSDALTPRRIRRLDGRR